MTGSTTCVGCGSPRFEFVYDSGSGIQDVVVTDVARRVAGDDRGRLAPEADAVGQRKPVYDLLATAGVRRYPCTSTASPRSSWRRR